MRYLAVDHGSRRIGLAISDPGGRIASPLKQLAATGDGVRDAAAVLAEAAAAEAGAIVVGLPLNMDGSHGSMAAASAAFADRLREAGGLPVHLFDERLTSHAADAVLDAAGWKQRSKRRKARRDMLAACVLLQRFLDER
jgi:putative Holliday junction resolvase